MRTMTKTPVIAAFLAVLAAAVGCEDTALAPGKDYTMTAVAVPSAVLIDATHPTGQATIVATVYSDAGVPTPGIAVIFSANGGVLNSGASGVDTDGNGRAEDTLTIDASSPAEVTVTATASALTATAKVTKTATATNRSPVAVIVATPLTEQAVGRLVIFDGSTSTDPDTGDSISAYAWSFHSNAPDTGWVNDEVRSTSGVSFPGFTNAQTITATLTVTDSHGLVSLPTQKVYAIKAQLCTDNLKPTAVIAGPATQTVVGTVGQPKSVALDGTLSSDPDGTIQTYTWSCGNGEAPSGTGANVTCDYLVQATAHTYTATLVVTDSGLPVGSQTCAQSSTPTTVSIIVSP